MKPYFEESDLEGAIARGYDVVQFKYSGHPVSVGIFKGKIQTYSLFDESELQETSGVPEDWNLTLLATKLDDVLIIHDCTFIDARFIKNHSYRDRYAFAKIHVAQLANPKVVITENFPIERAHDLWALLPAFAGTRNGIVFRKSTADFSEPVLCQRYYPEVPAALL